MSRGLTTAGEYFETWTIKCLSTVLTLLTFWLTILLKNNSGRSGMDLHVPKELMYFSLYLTWGGEIDKTVKKIK